jgi:aryl-alcohol dehydrogenase-like predicted oxidoreductase
LTGKYRRNRALPEGARLTLTRRMADRYLTERNWGLVERLEGYAARHGHSLLELAFGWLLARPAVASVIAGATRPEQVEANVQAAAAWRPTADQMQEIDRLTAV